MPASWIYRLPATDDDPTLNADENKKRRSEIDLIANTYSGPAFAFGNFDKIAHNLRNFRCNGTNLFTTSKDDAKDKETAITMFPGYADIQTKFLVLQESIEKEKNIIDLVRNDQLAEISETATPGFCRWNFEGRPYHCAEHQAW